LFPFSGFAGLAGGQSMVAWQTTNSKATIDFHFFPPADFYKK
jgi:hypothetical protein